MSTDPPVAPRQWPKALPKLRASDCTHGAEFRLLPCGDLIRASHGPIDAAAPSCRESERRSGPRSGGPGSTSIDARLIVVERRDGAVRGISIVLHRVNAGAHVVCPPRTTNQLLGSWCTALVATTVCESGAMGQSHEDTTLPSLRDKACAWTRRSRRRTPRPVTTPTSPQRFRSPACTMRGRICSLNCLIPAS